MAETISESNKLSYEIIVKIFYRTRDDNSDIYLSNEYKLKSENIKSFKIIKNPKVMNIVMYRLNLSGIDLKDTNILSSYDNMAIQISIIESGSYHSGGIIFDNIFSVSTYKSSRKSFNGVQKLEVEYNLISDMSLRLLQSKLYANADTTITEWAKSFELLDKVVETIFTNVDIPFKQQRKLNNLVDSSLNKKVLITKNYNNSGNNIQVFKDLRFPSNDKVNDINVIQKIIDKYRPYLFPTYFICDDSRGYIEASSNNFVNVLSYIIPNLSSLKELPKIDARSASYLSEFQFGSNIKNIGLLINKEDLDIKLNSNIHIKHSDDTISELLSPSDSNNVIILESDITIDVYLLLLKNEQYFLNTNAEILSFTFNNMSYNTLEYNHTYNILDKSVYDLVLLSMENVFKYDANTKKHTMKTYANFIKLELSNNITNYDEVTKCTKDQVFDDTNVAEILEAAKMCGVSDFTQVADQVLNALEANRINQK